MPTRGLPLRALSVGVIIAALTLPWTDAVNASSRKSSLSSLIVPTPGPGWALVRTAKSAEINASVSAVDELTGDHALDYAFSVWSMCRHKSCVYLNDTIIRWQYKYDWASLGQRLAANECGVDSSFHRSRSDEVPRAQLVGSCNGQSSGTSVLVAQKGGISILIDVSNLHQLASLLTLQLARVPANEISPATMPWTAIALVAVAAVGIALILWIFIRHEGRRRSTLVESK